MFRLLVVSLLIIGFTSCASADTETPTLPATPSPSLPTDWAGGITRIDGTIESIVVRLTETTGTLNVQPQTETFQIKDIQRADAMISFDVMQQSMMHFSGTFGGDQITGQLEQNDQTGSFTLLPLYMQASGSLDDFFGTYQFASGEALLINSAPEYSQSGLYFFGQGLMVTHFGTGAIRGLYPVGKDTFLVGSARAIGYPFAEGITFSRDAEGKVTGLSWQIRNPVTGKLGEAEMASRLDIKSEIVHYTSADGINLAALLTLPAGPGPYPAILMLHGSNPGTRDDFGDQQMSAFMASQGIAILTYDKRGVGDSGGHYSESASETNLNLTAQDAIAGVEYLKSRPEIIANRIGLIGFSQAGWVIPLAASQSDDVAYFIILSGPITSVGHENLYSSYTNNGESPAQMSQDEIMLRLSTAAHSGFNSAPVIAALNQPGLWIWGDQDKSIPVPESETNLKALIDQGQSSFIYAILPNADHNLQQTTQGLFNEIPYSPGFHEDYYLTMIRWLEAHVKSAP